MPNKPPIESLQALIDQSRRLAQGPWSFDDESKAAAGVIIDTALNIKIMIEATPALTVADALVATFVALCATDGLTAAKQAAKNVLAEADMLALLANPPTS